jgi:hypothetical protein
MIPANPLLAKHLSGLETRLRALEGAVKEGQPQDDVDPTHQSSESLWNRMYEDAARSSGECSDANGKDGAAMIRAVVAWIEQWVCSNQIDAERLMQALEAEAQAAQVER